MKRVTKQPGQYNAEIRKKLKDKGLSQKKFAEIMHINPGSFGRMISQGEIADWVKQVMIEVLDGIPDKVNRKDG